ELVGLDEQHIGLAFLGQVVSERAARDPTSDDERADRLRHRGQSYHGLTQRKRGGRACSRSTAGRRWLPVAGVASVARSRSRWRSRALTLRSRLAAAMSSSTWPARSAPTGAKHRCTWSIW